MRHARTDGLQVLRLRPQGCCLNNAHISDVSKREQYDSLTDFWQAYQEHEVALPSASQTMKPCRRSSF